MSAVRVAAAARGGRSRLLRFVVWVIAATLIAAAWLGYRQPDLLLDLATVSFC